MFSSRRALVFFIALFTVLPIAAAQEMRPAPTPIADPSDTRFVGAKEDWATPALNTSHLKMAIPLSAGVDSTHPAYTVELLNLQWRWGDPIDLYVIKPAGVKKPPVILYLYGYPTDTDQFKNEAWQRAVTRNDFAAVGFVSALTGHRYHDRPMKEWFISELQECLATSAHDVQMMLSYLSSRDDLDMDRVGVFAEGSGATIAILASAVDARIKVLDVVDPWGDWPTWMATSPFVPKDERADYVKPEYLKKVSTLDPVDWLPKVKARKFRYQDALFEEITPRTSKDKLRAAVPSGAMVQVYNTPKDYAIAINGNKQMGWMYSELRALPEATAGKSAALQKK